MFIIMILWQDIWMEDNIELSLGLGLDQLLSHWSIFSMKKLKNESNYQILELVFTKKISYYTKAFTTNGGMTHCTRCQVSLHVHFNEIWQHPQKGHIIQIEHQRSDVIFGKHHTAVNLQSHYATSTNLTTEICN